MSVSKSLDVMEVRTSVRKLAQHEIPPYQTEQHYGSVPKTLFKKLAELGIAGLTVSEEHGGIATGSEISSAVIEEIAATDLGPAIFIAVHNMVAGMIQRFGTTLQCNQWLARLSSGQALAAFALTEPAAGSDARGIQCRAVEQNSSYILSGSKSYITSAGWADVYLVFAVEQQPANGCSDQIHDKTISAFLVAADTPGLSISPPEKKMGCELSPIASLSFSDMSVPATARLGESGQGLHIAMSGLAAGRVSIASAANGLSRAAINAALQHMRERSQFGQKLVEFQGLQFMLADMYMQHRASLQLTLDAARAIDQGAALKDLRLRSSTAKCFATDSAMKITTDAVQLLGGAGYVNEYQVERYMRDAKMLQIVEGTNQIQRMVIGRELSEDGYFLG